MNDPLRGKDGLISDAVCLEMIQAHRDQYDDIITGRCRAVSMLLYELEKAVDVFLSRAQNERFDEELRQISLNLYSVYREVYDARMLAVLEWL